MRREIESFLHRNMSRKDFLRHCSLMVLSVIGIGGLLRYISGGDTMRVGQKGKGYGKNSYGGDNLKSKS